MEIKVSSYYNNNNSKKKNPISFKCTHKHYSIQKKKVDSLISHTHKRKTKSSQCCHTKPKANKRVWLTTTTIRYRQRRQHYSSSATTLLLSKAATKKNNGNKNIYTHTYIRIYIVYVHTFTLFFSFFFCVFRRGS